MLIDLFHLPDQGIGDVRYFDANNSAGNFPTVFHEWRKPKGCTLVQMIAGSSAGGGGAGFSRSAGNPGGGGGGGGPGVIANLLVAANLLPDVLYISVGIGGLAGAAGNATQISIQPSVNIAAFNLLLLLQGALGSVGTAGGGGAGGAAAAISTQRLNFLGLTSAANGATGANGGAQSGAVGGSVSYLTFNGVTHGGSGGAGSTGTNFAGGNQTSPSTTYYPTLLGGATAGLSGASGIQLPGQFIFLGGAGGASNDSGTGGNGGDGALCCGGGGGGAGVTGGTGGRGGKGFAMMISI